MMDIQRMKLSTASNRFAHLWGCLQLGYGTIEVGESFAASAFYHVKFIIHSTQHTLAGNDIATVANIQACCVWTWSTGHHSSFSEPCCCKSAGAAHASPHLCISGRGLLCCCKAWVVLHVAEAADSLWVR